MQATTEGASLAQRVLRLRMINAARNKDRLKYWRFGVERFKRAFGMFTGDNPIDELHLRGPNRSGKTLTKAAFVVACLQKRRDLDGVPIPQWRGRVKGLQLVLDLPQQLLSVKPAYLEALGDWPHKVKNNGEYLHSIHVMPVGGDPKNERDWSVLYFQTQKNPDTGRGARADIIDFDEPPKMFFLQELRKAASAGRRSIRIVGETPEKLREWAPIRQDYGDTPRRSLRRVDQDRAEVRWSLDEVARWVLSEDEKAKMRRAYANDPLKDAREHGDYSNAEGSSPWGEMGMLTLLEMLPLCKTPEVQEWRVSQEVTGEEVPRGTYSPYVSVQGRELPWPESLQNVSRLLHEGVAEVASANGGPEEERLLSGLRQRLSAAWPAAASALRDLWGQGAEAPRRLLQAVERALAMQEASPGAPLPYSEIGRTATTVKVPVQFWEAPKRNAKYYIDIDPASGVDDGKHNPAGLHVSEMGTGNLVARWNGYLAPYSLGVLAAALARQYNEAPVDIEMKDHWGVNVVRGCQASRYGNLASEQRELKPGVWAKEVGFDQNEETKAIIIGQIQEWLDAWRAGNKYADCPSSEVIECLINCELDERGKVVAGPGVAHGEDMILLGQKLRRAVARLNRSVPELYDKPRTADDRLIAMIQGKGEESDSRQDEAPSRYTLTRPRL